MQIYKRYRKKTQKHFISYVLCVQGTPEGAAAAAASTDVGSLPLYPDIYLYIHIYDRRNAGSASSACHYLRTHCCGSFVPVDILAI